LDHLLHVLTEKAIPHFIARHRRQEFGFEGPDLEIKRRIEVAQRATTIEKSDITPDISDLSSTTYHVQSQSNPQICYTVDISAYDCSCLSFPIIRFCKHICAVQNHFPDAISIIPVASLSKAMILAPTLSDNSEGDDINDPATIKVITESTDSEVTEDIGSKLQDLANRLRFHPPAKLPESLLALNDHLDVALSVLQEPAVSLLPRPKKIAPNQKSWTETAAVMGVAVKTKRKTTHTDPYSGGERSGKKAKPDARAALARPAPTLAASLIPAAPPAPAPTIAVLAPTFVNYTPVIPTNIPTAVPLPPRPPHVHLAPPPTNHYSSFNPTTFDLCDHPRLRALSRTQLNMLCKYHKIKARGTNENLIADLQGLLQQR
jgi:hypothetical protein